MVRATHSKINTVYVVFIVLYFITIEHLYCAPEGSPNALQMNKSLKGEKKSLIMDQKGHPRLTPVKSSRERTVRPNGQLWMAELDDVPTLASNGLEALGTGAVQTGREIKAKGMKVHDIGEATIGFGQNLSRYSRVSKCTGEVIEAGAIYAPDVNRGTVMTAGSRINDIGTSAGEWGTEIQYAGNYVKAAGGVLAATGYGVELAGKVLNYAGKNVPGWSKSES